ncbi:MAG: exodeoxyribonuclease gamma subunit [Chthoniobacter sp.]|jgi:exodeoxyribonuclease V gamma subunit|nr:exodeoxyribonuclease gamma subunit [Chthoniobacter sp.]
MPGLHVYRSNRLEVLAEALAAVTRAPLRSVLQPELLIVQSLGMHRWLAQELAQRHGIAMNARFPFPASFAQEVFRTAFPGEEMDHGFNREVLPWRVLSLFPRLLKAPGWEDLQLYAKGELSALKEYQLAQRIGAVFDRYLAYRPELLLTWQAARGGDWQAQLWRELIKGREKQHPAALLRRLEEQINTDLFALADLPERVSLFGISSLPPFYLHLIQSLARRIEVHLFLLEPTDQYWGDIQSRREQDRILCETPETAEDLHLETGNPLLSSLGTVGRDFTRLVQDLEPTSFAEAFVAPDGVTLLSRVQADIFELRERPASEEPELRTNDGSIRIQCCHGPMREVEVLHDQLLDLFERLPGLTPRDILVAMPDVEAYAPFIDAVFGAPDDDRHAIPFTIADRSAVAESCVADTFLQLLDLHGSRFTAPAVLALLEDSALRRKFEFAEGDLDIIRGWVVRTGIRWGIDADHRAQLGLPRFSSNTWRAGLERLLLGYALPGDGRILFDGILPVPEVEGAFAAILGRFVAFAETLFDLVPKLAAPRSLGDWERTLRQLLRAFFDDGDESADEVRGLREVFTSLGETMHAAEFSAPVTFEVLRAHLGAALAESDSGFGFLAGSVTFGALKPMRAIPFKVICLLGLNDTAFPRRDPALAFDVISAQRPRRGDRSRRDDDRYLFLEAILSAREVLYLSYSGSSPRDNSAAPPSVVVSELLDYLEAGFGLAPSVMVTRQRLQPFSSAYFGGDPRLFSYSRENARTSERGRGPRTPAAAFTAALLPDPGPEWRQLEVHQLAEFLAHPAKCFARDRLRLAQMRESSPLEECEPLELAGLARYGLGQELSRLALSGAVPASHLEVARASGLLPPGYVGGSTFGKLSSEAAELVTRIRTLVPGAPLPPLSLDATIGQWRLSGTFHEVYAGAQLRHRPAPLKGKDVLRAWVWHLALQLTSDGPRETLLFALDATWRFHALDNARDLLGDLLALRADGLRQPLPLFPSTSMEFARRKLEPRKREKTNPLAGARTKWVGSDRHPGPAERDDSWFQLCFPADPLDAAWQALAERVFAPIFAAREELPL